MYRCSINKGCKSYLKIDKTHNHRLKLFPDVVIDKLIKLNSMYDHLVENCMKIQFDCWQFLLEY